MFRLAKGFYFLILFLAAFIFFLDNLFSDIAYITLFIDSKFWQYLTFKYFTSLTIVHGFFIVLFLSFASCFFKRHVFPQIVWKIALVPCLFVALFGAYTFISDLIAATALAKFSLYAQHIGGYIWVTILAIMVSTLMLAILLSYLYPMYELGYRKEN